MGERTVDFVVVGAGSAGCVIARRLVDSGASVLLLEAGGADVNEAIHDPARAHELWLVDEDWAYHTAPQEHAADRRLHWPRGRVLGGSSALNAMIYVRGHRTDYDAWAAAGNPGWSYDEVLPVYKRLEDFDRGASEYHGAGGTLPVMADFEPDEIQRDMVFAAQETGIPRNDDYNGAELDGVSHHQFTIRGGRRQSTAVAYLRPIEGHAGLEVLTGAHVHRLVFEGTRCVGVEWERDGRSESVRAGSEVVVCAGAIGSPHLLLRTGIGPAGELAAHGIDTVADLAGVGRNLHDHLLVPLIYNTNRPVPPPAPGLPYTQGHFFTRSRADVPAPDIQPINFGLPMYEEWMDGPPDGFTMMAGMIRPQSRGSLRLSGPGPDDELIIDPATYAEPVDLETMLTAVELVREVGQADALRGWGAQERYPGTAVTGRDDLLDYIRRTSITYHHQVGTCRMGPAGDAEAVVDPELRVHGVEQLRVADASVMPAVTSGNTNAPSILIGERAADLIRAAHGLGAAELASAGG